MNINEEDSHDYKNLTAKKFKAFSGLSDYDN